MNPKILEESYYYYHVITSYSIHYTKLYDKIGFERKEIPKVAGIEIAIIHVRTSEKQFRKLYQEANRKEGNTGNVLIQLLEQRLDNVVYRMGFATTRASARQFVNHGHILVDGKRVDIPSFRVKAGQKVEVREQSKNNAQIQRAIELTNQTGMVEWVDVDKEKLFGIFTRVPERDEISIPVEERLIVELYSK